MIERDIIRLHDTESNLASKMRAGQDGYSTDTHKYFHKMPDGTLVEYGKQGPPGPAGDPGDIDAVGVLKGTGTEVVAASPDTDFVYPTATRVVDADGNVYKTVRIGNQLWMAEDYRCTKLDDGTDISQVTGSSWTSTSDPAYCHYSNDSQYAILYNAHAAMHSDFCPAGWRIPTDADWDKLVSYLTRTGHDYDGGFGTDAVNRAICKPNVWDSDDEPGSPGLNPELCGSSGLGLTPVGKRDDFSGNFSGGGDSQSSGYYWSSTLYQSSTDTYWVRAAQRIRSYLYRTAEHERSGLGVRMVLDLPSYMDGEVHYTSKRVIAEGGPSGTPESVSPAGVNRVQVTPLDGSAYYQLEAGHDGQTLIIENRSSSITAVFDFGYVSSDSGQMLIYSDDTWMPIS